MESVPSCIPSCLQKLRFEGRELEDNKTLSE